MREVKSLADHLKAETAKHMAEALRMSAGCHRGAAALLELPLATYYRKLRELVKVNNGGNFF